MKRVVVTGATGFVGSNLARRLLQEGHEVHLLVRRQYTPWRIDAIQKDAHIHFVEFSDIEALKSTIASIHPDWVFHLAAYGAYSSQSIPRQAIETNLVATINLVDACTSAGFEVFVNSGPPRSMASRPTLHRKANCWSRTASIQLPRLPPPIIANISRNPEIYPWSHFACIPYTARTKSPPGLFQPSSWKG